MVTKLTNDTDKALKAYNSAFGKSWDLGTNFNNQGTEFTTFVNNYLFPKINETALIEVPLGNRFNFLAKESTDFIGQFSEEYVILDSVPVTMNLNKNEELMLKRNYPKMATKLYGSGILKKQKFTLNNNDTRLNFSTIGDAVKYALAVYNKKISDINVLEEKEIKAMLVDFALEQTANKRSVLTKEELFDSVFEAILNIQNNSDKYNEIKTASGGAIGRYTTVSSLNKVAILTTDKMKTFLLNTKLATTFQVAGLDLSSKIISFDDLGGVYKVTEDITLDSPATIAYFQTFGDYQVAIGDLVEEGSIITFDLTGLTEFVGKFEEVKPATDLFAYVFDIDKIRYKRNTKGMLKQPFNNPEFDEVTHWIHYYSFKAMSPFFNNVLIGG